MMINDMTFGMTELAGVLGLEVSTVRRLASQHPERLPPCVILKRLGATSGKRIWLQATVLTWLKSMEEGQQEPEPVESTWAAPNDTVKKRGRGRPRKT